MGAAKSLDKVITHFWGLLSIEQKKVVLSMIKSFAREKETWIDDKAYIAEMYKRFSELETGKVKGHSLEALAKKTRQVYKTKKQNIY